MTFIWGYAPISSQQMYMLEYLDLSDVFCERDCKPGRIWEPNYTTAIKFNNDLSN